MSCSYLIACTQCRFQMLLNDYRDGGDEAERTAWTHADRERHLVRVFCGVLKSEYVPQESGVRVELLPRPGDVKEGAA